MSRFLLFPLIVITAFIIISCQETLPLRNDPSNVFITKLTAIYTLSAIQNDVTFFLIVKNNYDESLQGQTSLNGTLYIEWVVDTKDRGPINPVRTVQLSPANVIHSTSFDAFNRTITIDPGDSLVLAYRWDYKTDDNTNVKNYFIMINDYSCLVSFGDHSEYRRYSRQSVKVQARLKLFDKTAYIVPMNYQFNFCYQDLYFSSKQCPSLICN